jgi:benzoyl-CoA reductase subunit C
MVEKVEHSTALRELIPELKNKSNGKNKGTRLMLLGSENDDIEFVKMVESCGATIVIDDHCVGTRYFWNNVDYNGGDPIEAIARRYIERPSCPSKDWMDRN